jgi:signal transduction histidine kinase
MTSHELRNPLSAVVQCADSVLNTLSTMEVTQTTKDEIETCIDSLQTIVSCSLHQKRVIDDVLTLSKLDSKLLLITPMRVKPAVVVSEAMKMFDVECAQMQISLSFKEDESLKGFEWVMIDPSRMLQVLINLLTNAIKFTKDSELREITVTLGGSTNCPATECQTVTFAEDYHNRDHVCDRPEWGTGTKGYLWLKVYDTGCGMTKEEQKKLFARFSQATPRKNFIMLPCAPNTVANPNL